MGKTKIKVIDASQPEADEKPKKKLGRYDELVEKLNKELEAEATEAKPSKSSRLSELGEVRSESVETEARGDAEEGSRRVAAANKVSEDAGAPRRGTDTEAAGPRAVEKKTQTPSKAKPRSKKYQEISKDLDRSKTYSIPEAIDMVKKLSYAKFNATLEAHINIVQTGLRGLISLPYASGKKLRILVFGHLPEPSEYEGLSFGDDSSIESISQGKVGFDLIITTPKWMPKLAKVAKILGPRGLMPNPKNGTIADDLKKAVESFQAGKTEYKTEPKSPVIHLGLGKLNQPNEELTANVKILLQTIGKTRIKKVSLSPTMGPSVKVDLTSF